LLIQRGGNISRFDRVAAARGWRNEAIHSLVKQYEGPPEPTVNVLEINLALDGLK